MNKFNLLTVLKSVVFPLVLFIFASCEDDDKGINSNTIVGKWHISATSSDKLIFNPDNTGLWVHGSEIKEFTWRVGDSSNAITVEQKFPGNKSSDWILTFFKEECTENILNGSYETYTYNVGYIDNKGNSIIKLMRHTDGCSYVDYNGPSDWENYKINGDNGGGENSGNGNGNTSGGDNSNSGQGNESGGGNHHYPCKSCDESGECWSCHGSGTNPITKKTCTTCHGSGKCQTCQGKGYIIV